MNQTLSDTKIEGLLEIFTMNQPSSSYKINFNLTGEEKEKEEEGKEETEKV